MEMLGSSNILALVGGGINPNFPPHYVIIWDSVKLEAIWELRFKETVLGVRMQKGRSVASALGDHV